MLLARNGISVFGFFVRSPHMFAIGLQIEATIYFTIASLIIVIPTGTKLYNGLSRYSGNITTIRTIILLFVVIFIMGVATAIILANNVLALALQNIYYVVSHFHYVLSISAILGLLSGFAIYNQFYTLLSSYKCYVY
jgi:cytochrome c oxidase subunit 1